MGKYKRDTHSSYVGLNRGTLLRDENWRRLSLRAKLFYIYLKAKYNGKNNGAIQLHFSELREHPGFNSRRAFYAAARELEASGWIKKTNDEKKSGLHRNPNTYKLTGQHENFAL